jgi:nucleoside-triphosphatase THEP1
METYFKQLPLALELSFDSLPAMVANIPDFKVLIRNPGSAIYQLLSQIDFRLEEIKNQLDVRIFIFTGAVGEGKTTHLAKLVETLRSRNLSVAGVLSPRIVENGKTTGYDLLDLVTGIKEPLLRRSEDQGAGKIGSYAIIPQGFKAGYGALKEAQNHNYQYIVVDEVGKLELEGQGWAPSLEELIRNYPGKIILTVRDGYQDQVIAKWNFKHYKIIREFGAAAAEAFKNGQ